MEIDLPEEPLIPLFGIYSKMPTMPQRHEFHYVHSSLLCDTYKLETNQMSHNKWIQKMWFICSIDYYPAIKH